MPTRVAEEHGCIEGALEPFVRLCQLLATITPQSHENFTFEWQRSTEAEKALDAARLTFKSKDDCQMPSDFSQRLTFECPKRVKD